MTTLTTQEQKTLACTASFEHITKETILGVGSGTTVDIFLELLANFEKKPTHPIVCASRFSEKKAKALGFSIASFDFSCLDIVVDGADHILSNSLFIKGGGGALFREKILAAAAKKWIVIADESKLKVPKTVCLPIEIAPFGLSSILKHLKNIQIEGTFRREGKELFITDQSNYILDVFLPSSSLKELEKELFSIAGVIDWGLFHNLTPLMYIGKSDGSLQRGVHE